MLDFFNQTTQVSCGLCEKPVLSENCSPKGCTHIFHPTCFEDWTSTLANDDGDEYKCPVSDCLHIFSEIVIRKTLNGSTTKVISLNSSQQCPICCEALQSPIATPESCNHTFCYVCLHEWSRIRHECPLDRGVFELILLFDKIGGPVTKRVSAPPIEAQEDDELPPEEEVSCEICSSPDDEAHLLLCDNCDLGYHTYCLPTPLSSIPSGDWFCPNCASHSRRLRSRNARTRRVHPHGLTHSEAEESDRVDSENDSLNSLDDEDMFANSQRLSSAAARLMNERASLHHRGSRLLRDTIFNLTQRVLSEESDRMRRRRIRRRCVRRQLLNDSVNNERTRGLEPSQRTLDMYSSTNSASTATTVRLAPRVTRTSVARSRTNPNIVSEESTRTSLSQVHRRRIIFMSDSDSASGDDAGREVTSSNDAMHPSTSNDSGTETANPSKRPRLCSAHVINGHPEQPVPSTSNAGCHNNSTVSQSSDTELESFTATTSKPRKQVRKSKKSTVKRKKYKSKKAKKGSKRGKKTVSRRKVVRRPLSKAQKKIKKALQSNSSSKTSASTNSSSPPRTPRKSTSSLHRPNRLSLFGAEPTFGGFFEDEPQTGSSGENKIQPECLPPTLTTGKSSFLSTIESQQASTFRFTTKNMQVNSDHSVCPIIFPNHSTTSSNNDVSKVSISCAPLSPSKLSTPTSSVNGTRSKLEDTSTRTVNSSLGWNLDRINQTRQLIQSALASPLKSGIIDKAMYERILDRSLYKVQQKPASKVSNERTVRLANEYVKYYTELSRK